MRSRREPRQLPAGTGLVSLTVASRWGAERPPKPRQAHSRARRASGDDAHARNARSVRQQSAKRMRSSGAAAQRGDGASAARDEAAAHSCRTRSAGSSCGSADTRERCSSCSGVAPRRRGSGARRPAHGDSGRRGARGARSGGARACRMRRQQQRGGHQTPSEAAAVRAAEERGTSRDHASTLRRGDASGAAHKRQPSPAARAWHTERGAGGGGARHASPALPQQRSTAAGVTGAYRAPGSAR